MRWVEVDAAFRDQVSRRGPPGVLVLHAGGNDLGRVPSRALVSMMLADIRSFCSEFSSMVVIWSEIVPRFHWRYARDQKSMDRTRIKINRSISKAVVALGGLSIRHADVERERQFFRRDGVHLNSLGLDLFCLNLAEKIKVGVELWRLGQR